MSFLCLLLSDAKILERTAVMEPPNPTAIELR